MVVNWTSLECMIAISHVVVCTWNIPTALKTLSVHAATGIAPVPCFSTKQINFIIVTPIKCHPSAAEVTTGGGLKLLKELLGKIVATSYSRCGVFDAPYETS